MGYFLKLEYAHSIAPSAYFSFKKCPIYTHDGANATFNTNCEEIDYSGSRLTPHMGHNPTL
jgi:hypothetical protein